jgi:hypothetical protein
MAEKQESLESNTSNVGEAELETNNIGNNDNDVNLSIISQDELDKSIDIDLNEDNDSQRVN